MERRADRVGRHPFIYLFGGYEKKIINPIGSGMKTLFFLSSARANKYPTPQDTITPIPGKLSRRHLK